MADDSPPDPAEGADPRELEAPPYRSPVDRAREFNIRARKNYDLGKFHRAIRLYLLAYDELPDAAFLFNIAQAYRQLDDCTREVWFYRRFLAVKPDAPASVRNDIDGYIASCEP